MPKVVYVTPDNAEENVELDVGASMMRGALDNGIAGIDGDCGGQCACATCHIYVDEAWVEKLGAPTDDEEAMLSTVVDRRPTSRLSCQIQVDETLEGLRVILPQSQH